MTREAFHQLVEQLTDRAAADPVAYRSGVVRFAGLGYAYLLFLTLLVFGLTGGCVWIVLKHGLSLATLKVLPILALLALLVAWSILRGFFARLPAPDGVRLRRKDAPELFAEIDSIRTAVGLKPVTRVYLDADYNATAIQRQIFSLFGPIRNWLCLGLPLLETLNRQELRFVVGHEFGHFGGEHGRFSGRINRQRAAWGHLLQVLTENSSPLTFLVTPFLKWYVPRLNAWTFVLMRAQEFEADAAGAHVGGAEAGGRALIKTAVFGRLCGEIGGKQLLERAITEEKPPGDSLLRLRELLQAGPGPGKAERWLTAAMLAPTTLDDTHPCLRERLEAMRVEHLGTEVPALPSLSSARELLGKDLEPLRQRVQEDWTKRIEPAWTVRYHQLQYVRQRLSQLPPGSHLLTAEDELERATLLLEVGREEDARRELRNLSQRAHLAPGLQARALFQYAALLLQDDDEAGLEPLEQAIELEPAHRHHAFELVRSFFERTGRTEEARRLYEEMEAQDAQMEAAGKERSKLTNQDVHEPHGLTSDRVGDLAAQLATTPRVRRAWLARKKLTHFTGLPLYILVIDLLEPSSKEVRDWCLARVSHLTSFEGDTLIFVGESEPAKLLRRIRRDPTALILDR